MLDIDNQTTLKIDEVFLDKIASSLTNKIIELIITSSDEIHQINKIHRGIDSPTDVLSFPYEDVPMSPVGSIVISSNYVQKVAMELGHTEDEEFALLFIHGLLHLKGFDHEVDDGEMREEEKKLIKKFNLPKSLIVRTQG